jgi:hypothetical protein
MDPVSKWDGVGGSPTQLKKMTYLYVERIKINNL